MKLGTLAIIIGGIYIVAVAPTMAHEGAVMIIGIVGTIAGAIWLKLGGWALLFG